jgi:hypothetical protein
MLGLFLIFLIGEGPPRPATIDEWIGTIALAIMLVGTLFGFRRPLSGGITILVGYLAFCVIDRDLNLTNPFVVFALIAVLRIANRWTNAEPRGPLA